MGPQELHPGSDVDGMCTRCKAVSGHIIVAMVGATIVKVKCNTCGSEHRFKAATVEKRAPAVKVRSTAAAPAKKSTKTADTADTGDYDRNYKPKVKPAKAPASGRTKAGKGTKGETDPAELHAQAMMGKEGNPVLVYTARHTYVREDLIQHPTFGVGVVLANRDNSKVDILFVSGVKTLVHARQ